jgi:hypothetical protein
MDTKTDKTKTKRPSKGMRKHIRLVKQEARKNSVPGTDVKKKIRPA